MDLFGGQDRDGSLGNATCPFLATSLCAVSETSNWANWVTRWLTYCQRDFSGYTKDVSLQLCSQVACWEADAYLIFPLISGIFPKTSILKMCSATHRGC